MANCFTARAGRMDTGIAWSETHGVVSLVLGETGRSRRRVDLPVVLTEGAPFDTNYDGHRRPVLFNATVVGRPPVLHEVVEEPEDGAVLVRIDTEGTYTRGNPGSLDHGSGEGDALWCSGAVKEVARGQRAWGDAGNLGTMPDVLLLLRPGALVRVIFSGGRSKGFGLRFVWYRPDALARGADPEVLDLGSTRDEDRVPDEIARRDDLEALALALAGVDGNRRAAVEAALAAKSQDAW